MCNNHYLINKWGGKGELCFKHRKILRPRLIPPSFSQLFNMDDYER